MKKILFASTALVATAGVAAADVDFSGYARWGIYYNENAAGVDETNLTSRYRLQIDATTESDGGITFGARVRIQQNAGGVGTGINDVRYFLRAGGLEVGFGNIYGALEWMPGQYPIDLGLTGLGYEYTAYNFRGDFYSSGGLGAGGRNGVEVLYSVGDLGIHVSASEGANERIAAVISYSFGDWTVAAGVQDSNAVTDTETTVTIGGTIGPVDLALAWADNGTSGDHTVIAGRVDVGAATNVEFYAADADYFAESSYGVDFNHDLGGGASLRGGIANRADGMIDADFGVRFNF